MVINGSDPFQHTFSALLDKEDFSDRIGYLGAVDDLSSSKKFPHCRIEWVRVRESAAALYIVPRRVLVMI